MATTLADLLDTTSREAIDPAGAPPDDRHAAFRHLGRALTNLVADGLDHQIGSYRDRFVTELAHACHATAHVAPPHAGGRLTELAAATADTVTLLRAEFTHASRWATALAVTDTIRHIAAGCEPPASPIAPLPILNRATVLVLKTGALEPPAAADRIMLDRPIPKPAGAGPRAPGDVIDESIASLIHHTRPGTDVSVTQVLAVMTVAETLCRHASAANADSRQSPHDAAATGWRAARLRLQRFHGADHRQQPGLLTAAIDLARALQEIAPSRWSDAITGSLHAALHRLPVLADHLDKAIQRWPTTHHVSAYATDLYRREERTVAILAGRRLAGMITVDQRDVVPARRAVRNAGVLSVRAAFEPANAVRATPHVPDVRHTVAARSATFSTPDMKRRANLAAAMAYRTITQFKSQAMGR